MTIKELLPELAEFDFRGREVMIAYDSDAVSKPRVQAAEERLARSLAHREAVVRMVRLPAEPGQKVALDDYLKTHSVEELGGLCYSAVPWQPYEPPLSFQELMDKDCPPVEWVWGSMILKGEVNLIYGDGGTGKSLLALHVGMHVAAGKPLFGRAVQQMPVLGMFTEDSEAEVKARLQTIQRVHNLPHTPLPLHIWCQPKEDTQLADIDEKGRVKELERLEALRSELRKMRRPALVILDGMADLFAIDETSRLPVTAAIKRVLGSLCRDYGATVLVLAHPSKASMIDGTHYSGSTAFNNAVRQRLTLEVVKDAGGGGPLPRRLSVAKSNYGAQDEVTLWLDSRALLAAPPGHDALTEKQIEDMVLREMHKLIGAGVRVVARNGTVGGAMSLNEFAKKVNSETGLHLPAREVGRILTDLRVSKRLGYVEADDSVKPKRKAQFILGAIPNE
jgi:hypothetical protein